MPAPRGLFHALNFQSPHFSDFWRAWHARNLIVGMRGAHTETGAACVVRNYFSTIKG